MISNLLRSYNRCKRNLSVCENDVKDKLISIFMIIFLDKVIFALISCTLTPLASVGGSQRNLKWSKKNVGRRQYANARL